MFRPVMNVYIYIYIYIYVKSVNRIYVHSSLKIQNNYLSPVQSEANMLNR